MSTDSTPNNPVAADQQLTISELKNQLARYEQVLAAPARDSDDDDFIDLREVWNLLWRRRWTIFIVAGVVLVATIIYTAMMTPIFRASTVLQIERDVGKVMEYAGVTTEERGTNDFYQTQYELLQSRTLYVGQCSGLAEWLAGRAGRTLARPAARKLRGHALGQPHG